MIEADKETDAPELKVEARSFRPTTRRTLPKGYVALWSLSALISLGYLSIAITAPGLLGSFTSDGSNGKYGGARLAATEAEPEGGKDLQDSLTRARMEIAKLRTELTMQGEETSTPAKVTTSPTPVPENTTVQPKTVAAAQPEIATQPEAAPAAAPALRSTTAQPIAQAIEPSFASTNVNPSTVAVVMPPNEQDTTAARANAAKEATIAQATILNRSEDPKPAKIETGSIKIPPPPVRGPERPRKSMARLEVKPVKTTPIAFAAPVIERAKDETPKLGIRLASGATLEAIQLSWSLMTERHADVLVGLTPRYVVEPSAAGNKYRLIAGPLGGAAQALQLCQDVSARGLPCEIGDFAGNAL